MENLLKQTTSPELRKRYEKRVDALKRIAFLQEKVDAFKKRFGVAPRKLEQLIQQGIITAIPEDPYGGDFFVDQNGRVYTTSKLVEVQAEKK